MVIGYKVTAQRANEMGFVNSAVPNGQHEVEALKMIEGLLGCAQLVIS